MSSDSVYSIVDVSGCFSMGEPNYIKAQIEYASNRSFTDDVALCQQIHMENFYNCCLGNIQAIASEITHHRTRHSNGEITDEESQRLCLLEKAIEELGFTGIDEIESLTPLKRGDSQSKYVFACTLYARHTYAGENGNGTTLYRQSLVRDMHYLLNTGSDGQVDNHDLKLATRQCAIILVKHAASVLRNKVRMLRTRLPTGNWTVYDRHLIQFALLSVQDIVNIGYEEWKKIFIDIFGRFGCTFVDRTLPRHRPASGNNIARSYGDVTNWPLVTGSIFESVEDNTFYTAVWDAYESYVRTKSTSCLLEIEDSIAGVVRSTLTALRTLQRQPRLKVWKSPFQNMPSEDIDRLANSTVSSVRQSTELLGIISNVVSPLFENTKILFETEYPPIIYYVSPDEAYRLPIDNSIRPEPIRSLLILEHESESTEDGFV
jgi:hypothetical protein